MSTPFSQMPRPHIWDLLLILVHHIFSKSGNNLSKLLFRIQRSMWLYGSGSTIISPQDYHKGLLTDANFACLFPTQQPQWSFWSSLFLPEGALEALEAAVTSARNGFAQDSHRAPSVPSISTRLFLRERSPSSPFSELPLKPLNSFPFPYNTFTTNAPYSDLSSPDEDVSV